MKLKEPIVTAFLHDQSSTITYLVVDKATNSAAVIDPVADYDISTGKMSHNF
ncbi:MAG: MBL fold metallo-hydrolase, partial [Rhodospirillaceae bacterium]|nr:MBL fold metallo-hydrolase [Rhodospirillaceae bacterium]